MYVYAQRLLAKINKIKNVYETTAPNPYFYSSACCGSASYMYIYTLWLPTK